ncbi:MAG: hypothetical protein HUJ68_00340 [Clostridia bacterium]|nr:hypothetical protein [Clostridia bacterium]
MLSKEKYELLEKIIKFKEEELLLYLKDFLLNNYNQERVVATEDYLIAFGDIPVGLVAHLDTVHTTPVKDLYYDKDQNIMWSPQGLGADDRAGVFAIMEILYKGLRPTVIFTTEEETGGRGAEALTKQIPTNPNNLKFLIELDRRGEDDMVFYDYGCCSESFSKFIKEFGFKNNYGSFSDIAIIAPEWNICSVNLSIGYLNEHSTGELLNTSWLYQTIDRVSNILKSVKEDDYFEYNKENYTNPYYGYYDDWEDYYLKQEAEYESQFALCWGCLDTFKKSKMVFPYGEEESAECYCKTCYDRVYTTCINCKTDFQDKYKTHLLCRNCREILKEAK